MKRIKKRNYNFIKMLSNQFLKNINFNLKQNKILIIILILIFLIKSINCYKTTDNLIDLNTTPMTKLNHIKLDDNDIKLNSNILLNNFDELNSTTNIKTKRLKVGNELWDNLIKDCYDNPKFSCFQKNIYFYLDKTLNVNDLNVTNFLKLHKNKINYTNLYTKELNVDNNDNDKRNDNINAKDNDNNGNKDVKKEKLKESYRSDESPIQEVTNALYDKSIKFAMTHDVELKLPEIMFDGSTLKIEPRSIEGNGVIVKLELLPKTDVQTGFEGRIFKKKIQHFFKNKLLLSFLALIIIIKLIKIKIFWLLPIIIGVGAAKKFLLKVLLFLFPALSHLFKLCHYYHNNYYQTKYHHHHHSINHHHTVSPPWLNDHDYSYTASIPHGPDLIFTRPPAGPPIDYGHSSHISSHHQSSGLHQPYNSDWDLSGPGLGSEYISDGINRNAQVENGYFKSNLESVNNELNSWGIGNNDIESVGNVGIITVSPNKIHPSSHNYQVNPFLKDQHSLMKNKIRLKNDIGPVYIADNSKNNKQTAVGIVSTANEVSPQYDQAAYQKSQARLQEALRIQAEQRLISQQQKILQQQPFIQDGKPIMPKSYDTFYSPILMKMDKIFAQLGFYDDYCKERLVCSMYKNPQRYSPHSNFISAELSRDPNELKKPTETNEAVIRFYRFIQAARDGQEQNDCMHLYSQCAINTE